MDEAIIKPQIGAEVMQLDLQPFDDSNNEEARGELDWALSEGEADLEPCEGMEFESEEAARAFYGAYARRVGFRVRISRYTRSRRDNSIISRLIVCSKEGFRESRGGNGDAQRQRAVTRVGCKAMLMVKKLDSGKWVASRFVKEHNHGPVPPRKLAVRVVAREEDLTADELNLPSDDGVVNEPFQGMEFDSEDDARTFYINYARQMGFRARISKYCRSRRDNSIISRQIVCSREGFREVRFKKEEPNYGRVKRPRVVTRVGCKAMIIVKKMNTGKWVVSRFEKEHNHALTSLKEGLQLIQSSNNCTDKGTIACVGRDYYAPSNVGMVTDSHCCDQSQGASRESLTVLYNHLCHEAIKYAQEGAVSEEIFTVAMSALKEAAEKVAAAKRSASQGGHESCITKCTNGTENALSGSELLMQQGVKFVLIPSTSFSNNSKPNHSVESPMILDLSNAQGIRVTDPISLLKQSAVIESSVKGVVRNAGAEHLGAGQDSQKLDNVGVSQEKTTPGNGISPEALEPQMVAFPALPLTLYMPVMGRLSESSSVPAASTACTSTYALVASLEASSPAATGTVSQVAQLSPAPAKDTSSNAHSCPNPLVHATAIAAGARVIPPEEAALLIKALQARVKSSTRCKRLSGNVSRSPWPCHSTEGMPKAGVAGTRGSAPRCVKVARSHETGGFKEMDDSAVYDSPCEDHLFSDGGS